MILWRLITSLGKRIQRTTIMKMLVVVLFIGLGLMVTMAAESKSCESADALAAHADDSEGECTEAYTVIDAFYFSMVTMSTVGYGDFSPSSTGFRVFTVFYILIGCTVVFVYLSELCATLLERYRQLILALVDRFDTTTKLIDTTGDGKGDTEIAGRAKGLSGRGVDLSGDGKVDFIEPPAAFVFWAQELLPAVVLWLVLQLVSASIFVVCQSDLDFGTALYHCFITATTVGYGDVALHTQAARLWASLHILVSVSWLAALIGQLDTCTKLRKGQLDRAVLLTRPLRREQVVALDHDGSGVDKLEFVIGMLQLLGVELCGEALDWGDVVPFVKKFEELDTTRTGTISKEDLEAFYEQDVAEQQRRIERMKWSTAARTLVTEHQSAGPRSSLRRPSVTPKQKSAAEPMAKGSMRGRGAGEVHVNV